MAARIAFRAFAILLAISIAGCGNQPTKVKTPAEVFDETHGGITETPHGMIKAGSARDVDGKVEYETADGARWQIGSQARPGGSIQFGTPEKVRD